MGTPSTYVGIKIDLARLYNAAHLYSKTVSLLPPITQRDIKSARVFSLLGSAYSGLGDQQRAIESFEAVVAISPKEASGYIQLALARFSVEQHAEAMSAIDAALELKPEWVYASFVRAQILASMDRKPEAIEALETLVESGTQEADVYRWLATLRLERGEVDKVEQLYTVALEAHPENVGLLSDAGKFFGSLKNYQRAITYLQKAHKITPNAREVRRNLSWAYARTGKYEEATALARGMN